MSKDLVHNDDAIRICVRWVIVAGLRISIIRIRMVSIPGKRRRPITQFLST